MKPKLASFRICQTKPIELDERMLHRIVDSFRIQDADFRVFLQRYRKSATLPSAYGVSPIATALADGDVKTFRDTLVSLFQTDSLRGIAMCKSELEMISSSSVSIRLYESQWHDTLIRFSEALGTIPCLNPEARRVSTARSPSELWREIEHTLEFLPRLPQSFGVYGCEIEGHIFPRLSFYHLLAADACRRIIERSANVRIVEIGGGFGGLANFLLRDRAVRYLCYDQPDALAIQAAFLSHLHPEIPIFLYGEAPGYMSGGCATFIPSWVLLDDDRSALDQAKIDLLINQDTMADLPLVYCDAVLKKLVPLVDGVLLSIGPDISVFNNSSLALGAAFSRHGLRLLDRSPFHVRPGYFKEIYCSALNGLGASRRNVLGGDL